MKGVDGKKFVPLFPVGFRVLMIDNKSFAEPKRYQQVFNGHIVLFIVNFGDAPVRLCHFRKGLNKSILQFLFFPNGTDGKLFFLAFLFQLPDFAPQSVCF